MSEYEENGDVAVVEDQGQESLEMGDPNIEIEARKLGWRPRDRFKGQADEWVEAEEFLKTHENSNHALRKRLERAEKQTEELLKVHKEQAANALAKQKQEMQAEIEFLKLQRRTAREEGDYERADEINDQLAELKQEASRPITPPVDPNAWKKAEGVPEWLEENPWADNEDSEERLFADALANTLVNRAIKQGRQPLQGMALLEEISRQVRRAFPEKQNNRMSSVTGASSRQSNNNTGAARSYAGLPSGAKAECDDFVRNRLGTKEDFIKIYNEYNG